MRASGYIRIVVLSSLLCSAGCLSTGAPDLDPQIRRSSEEAFQALAETSSDAALVHYRRAIRRAWAMNHQAEISRLSYNMAATLAGREEYNAAKCWLLESRAAAVQQKSADDVVRSLLLNAQIARKSGRLAEADAYLAQADGFRVCNTAEDPARSLTLPGCITGCFDKQKQRKLRALTLEIQSVLERAELFADQGNFEQADGLLAYADSLVLENPDLNRGSLHRTHARICELQGQFEQAGRHYFEEARDLRTQEQYRSMTSALESAAAAFEKAGDPIRAAELYLQAARSAFGRDATRPALELLKHAKRNADNSNTPALVCRVTLIFKEIDFAITGVAAKKNAPPTSALGNVEMPAKSNLAVTSSLADMTAETTHETTAASVATATPTRNVTVDSEFADSEFTATEIPATEITETEISTVTDNSTETTTGGISQTEATPELPSGPELLEIPPQESDTPAVDDQPAADAESVPSAKVTPDLTTPPVADTTTNWRPTTAR